MMEWTWAGVRGPAAARATTWRRWPDRVEGIASTWLDEGEQAALRASFERSC